MMIPKINGRMVTLKRMHEVMQNINDESYYMDWITMGVPDEPCDEDFEYIAENDEEYEDCVRIFVSLVHHAQTHDAF